MITAHLDMGPLLNTLSLAPRRVQAAMPNLVKDQVRLFIAGGNSSMIANTPPSRAGARGKAAKASGENAVKRDLAQVYLTPARIYDILKVVDEGKAKAYWRAVTRRDMSEQRRIISGMSTEIQAIQIAFFSPDAHQSRRGNDGRVAGSAASIGLASMDGYAAYRKKKLGNVGIYASGWNASALRTGAGGVPAWVKRHGTEFSSVSVQETPTLFQVTMVDNVPFGTADTVRRAQYVLGYRQRALQKNIERAIARMVESGQLVA